jgi:NaMN:DMB phosphoribosyltransferase
MRLGEGTGAVALFPLLETALAVYHNAATYADIQVNKNGGSITERPINADGPGCSRITERPIRAGAAV